MCKSKENGVQIHNSKKTKFSTGPYCDRLLLIATPLALLITILFKALLKTTSPKL